MFGPLRRGTLPDVVLCNPVVEARPRDPRLDPGRWGGRGRGPDDRGRPPEAGVPGPYPPADQDREIVSWVLDRLARINAARGRESFDLQGYLTASWVDPALARKPDEPRGERRFPPETLWTPNYEFTNAVEQVKVQNEAALVVDDRGKITQRFRFVGKFAWPLDLRRFPFDAQTLTVLVEPFERETKDVEFVVNHHHVGRMSTAFLTDWTIRDVAAKVEEAKYPAFSRTNSRLVVEIRIARESTFYLTGGSCSP